MRGRVLLLAPAFPPMPRLLKLARYLPDFGWDVHILTPRSRSARGDIRFAAANASLPQFEATFAIPGAVETVERWSRRWRRARPVSPGSGGVAPAFGGGRGLARQLLLWLSTPDDLVGWIPWATASAWRLARSRAVQAILATGPPFSCVLAGAAARSLTELPLVVDFRDAWTLDPVDPLGCVSGPLRAPVSGVRRRLLTAMERTVLRCADRVLFTSDRTNQAYSQAFPGIEEKSRVLLNGADEEDFVSPQDETSELCFTHVGTLHEFQMWQAELLLRAFATARREKRSGIRNARVRFYGHMPEPLRRQLLAVAAAEGIAQQVEVGGAIHHDRAVALMRGEGVVLMFAGRSLLTRLSKITDALVVGRPMLAFALAESETARHVRDGGGAVYSGDAPHSLADVLDEMARHPLARARLATSFPFPYPHPLHWRSMARAVAADLDNLTGCHQDAKGARGRCHVHAGGA